MLEEVNSSQILEDEQPNVMEVTLADFDRMVKQKHDLDKLLAMPEFQSIIVEGYLEEDFTRLSELLKNVKVNSKLVEDRAIIVDKIVAKGYLENFIKMLVINTEGIDNPEVRAALVKELEAGEEEAGSWENEDE